MKTLVVRAILLSVLLSFGISAPCPGATKKALLIGIDTYKNLPHFSRFHGRRFGNLKGAVDDVRIMMERGHDRSEEPLKEVHHGDTEATAQHSRNPRRPTMDDEP